MTPEQIAEDVSRRYGLPVSPDAVKIIPQGQMATVQQYVWTGNQLKLADGTTAKDTMRAAINARWRQHEHAKRLARAKDEPRKVHPQIIRSQERQAITRQLIEQGYTTEQLAAHFKTERNTMRKFLAKWGMKANPAPRKVRKNVQRLADLQAFTANGDKTIRDIADFLGIQWKAAQTYCINNGIPYRTKFKGSA